MRGERYQHRQEGDQVMMALIKLTPIFSSVEAKRMCLPAHAVRRLRYDAVVASSHVIFVHRRTPAEHVVTDKEVFSTLITTAISAIPRKTPTSRKIVR